MSVRRVPPRSSRPLVVILSENSTRVGIDAETGELALTPPSDSTQTGTIAWGCFFDTHET